MVLRPPVEDQPVGRIRVWDTEPPGDQRNAVDVLHRADRHDAGAPSDAKLHPQLVLGGGGDHVTPARPAGWLGLDHKSRLVAKHLALCSANVVLRLDLRSGDWNLGPRRDHWARDRRGEPGNTFIDRAGAKELLLVNFKVGLYCLSASADNRCQAAKYADLIVQRQKLELLFGRHAVWGQAWCLAPRGP